MLEFKHGKGYKKILEYTVIFEPADEGSYVAHVPALNDVSTQGKHLKKL